MNVRFSSLFWLLNGLNVSLFIIIDWCDFVNENMFSGVIGIKVKIMLPHDPRGQMGPKNALPDHVQILEPVPETNPTEPSSEHKVEKKDMLPIVPPPMQPVEVAQAY